MKNLEDFKDEINKCSKCGLCQSVCPVYKITGNDCAVSRGKFIMLDGVLKGDLKLNKNINNYLDLCLKCNKCSAFCPSAIQVCDIFTCAKSEYFKRSISGFITGFLQSRLVFNTFLKSAEIISSIFRKRYKISGKTKFVYFKGCVNQIYPKSENSLKKVLSEYDAELVEKDFECCGLPFLSSGNIKRFINAAKKNIELMSGDYDYILTDCSSCAFTIGEYSKYINDTQLPKTINICEYLSMQDKKFIYKKPVKVTFHKPCHLKDDNFIKSILKKCENVNYIEMENYDDCCGFAGEFAIKNPKISLEISKNKIQKALKTNADYILTTCPACIIGLNQGLIMNKTFGKKSPKVLNLIDFLAKADEII